MSAFHLIEPEIQSELSALIGSAVNEVIQDLPSYATEPDVTAALGSSLRRRSIDRPGLKVGFRYRGHHPRIEEPNSGADGGLLVRIENEVMSITKASLFQAKHLRGVPNSVTHRTIDTRDAERLRKQAGDMLQHTQNAVVMFYTEHGFYVVDAWRYRNAEVEDVRVPLGGRRRLLHFGTYLGKWMPRCTRGDPRDEFVRQVEHREGFRHGIEMDVLTSNERVAWK